MNLTPAKYATQVNIRVLKILDDNGMCLPSNIVQEFVRNRIKEFAMLEKVGERTAVNRFPDPDTYAFDIAANLLTEIVEERPSADTSPFDHVGQLPVNVSDVAGLIALLQWTIQTSLDAKIPYLSEVRPLNLATTQLCSWFSAEIGEKDYAKPLLMPIPGAAFLIRVMVSAAGAIENGVWQGADSEETKILQTIGIEISTMAYRLKQLKEAYTFTPPTFEGS